VVSSDAGRRALTEMLDEIYRDGIVPSAVLTWHEEETRFAFQNGESAYMRNWPYPVPLMQDSSKSRVAGKFSVAPMPAGPGGSHTAAIGGAQLAINRRTEHPEAAWAVIDYLTRPEQMRERARVVGQFPTRPHLYDDPDLASGLIIPPATIRQIIDFPSRGRSLRSTPNSPRFCRFTSTGPSRVKPGLLQRWPRPRLRCSVC